MMSKEECGSYGYGVVVRVIPQRTLAAAVVAKASSRMLQRDCHDHEILFQYRALPYPSSEVSALQNVTLHFIHI